MISWEIEDVSHRKSLTAHGDGAELGKLHCSGLFPELKRRPKVTVGIAAICHMGLRPSVICASDRMITSGDIEFEPPVTKIYPLTNSIVMLIAGDTGVQSEIYQAVREDVNDRIAADPKSWVPVKEVAEIVARQTAQYFSERASRTVLEPLGLDWERFVARQQDMRPEFYNQIMSAIRDCRPETETLVAGVDTRGSTTRQPQVPHVYEVSAWGDISCHDAAAFASIGAGRRHADSQFMFARHSASSDYPETLLLAYMAKKRAEAAPGVGRDTDLFTVVGLGGGVVISGPQVEELERIYKTLRERAEVADAEANERIRDHFRTLLEQAAEQRAAQEQGAGLDAETKKGRTVDDNADTQPQS